MYIINVIKNVLEVLTAQQRVKFFILMFFFLFSALLQIVGVASIAPFITILSNQEIIQKNEVLVYAYNFFGAASNNEFIIGFAMASLLMILVSNLMSALTLFLLLKFSIVIGCSLQSRLYANFLCRDYIYHKTTNYNHNISIISQEVPRFIYMVLQPFLLLMSQLCVAVLILLGLLLINPIIAFASGAIIGGSYLLTYVLVRKSLLRHGRIITERNRGMQAILSESFIGVKDIKLSTLEKKYISAFDFINIRGLNSAAYVVLSSDLPKFVIETISFGAILVLAIILLLTTDSTESVISILSIYALAGYKLLPTMQQIYKSISSMSANGSVVEYINNELMVKPQNKSATIGTPIATIKSLQLSDICYQYPNAENITLDHINLTFEMGKLNTIAGPSGSGKSTLADVMLGLLPASKGEIKANGQLLEGKFLNDYQASIGYVPQSIFILDDTVLANVAFGVAEQDVDIDKVNQALCQANAMGFVERLPQGINTQLGQDGKLLSGGQRQRIGIARTLYRDSTILILDEPTSALDIDSEYELMMLLGKLKEQVLVVVISHRPAAIKLSDSITLLAEGKVIASASYEELRATSSEFRETLERGMMD